METRANYVLIGAFAVAGFLGLLLFLMIFASVQLDRRFTYFDVRFQSVSGLSRASEVRFEGFPVGQVVDVRLSPDMDGTIVARIEVDENTPVRTDSVARISSQGVTGVAFVALSAGSPDAPLLRDTAEIPEIPSERGTLDALFEDAPRVVSQVLDALERVNDVLSDENRGRVDEILINIANASANLDGALDDFAEVTRIVADASTGIAAFTERLEPVADAAVVTLGNIDTTLETYDGLARRVETTLDTGDETLRSARAALDTVELFLADDLPALTRDLTETSASLRARVDDVSGDARTMLASFTQVGDEAALRLREARGTLRAADTMIARLTDTLDSVDSAARSFDALIEGDGSLLVTETREMIAAATTAVVAVTDAATEDLPAVMADIRRAADTAARVVETVGADLSRASGRVDGVLATADVTLTQVGETFVNANDTLSAINRALEIGERTLSAAERAFDGADRVINEELDGMIADLRAAARGLEGAIAQVSEDIPAITRNLRATLDTADEAFLELADVISRAGPAVVDFANQALPQYTQIGRETRALITNLERLLRQIERDPARFLFGRTTPEFSR